MPTEFWDNRRKGSGREAQRSPTGWPVNQFLNLKLSKKIKHYKELFCLSIAQYFFEVRLSNSIRPAQRLSWGFK